MVRKQHNCFKRGEAPPNKLYQDTLKNKQDRYKFKNNDSLGNLYANSCGI